MGLISRMAHKGRYGKSRLREPLRTATPAPNRNRRARFEGAGFSLPLGAALSFGRNLFSFNWARMAAVGLGAMLLCLAVLGVISVALLFGYRYATNSSYFGIKNLEVTGNFRLTSREVLDMVGLHEGDNALLVSIDAIERGIAASPWIKSVSVRRELPDGFVIRLVEREPRFWVRRNGVLYYADAMGHEIVAVSPGQFASLPTLEVEPGAEDLTARLPELLASFAGAKLAVDVTGVSGVRLSPGRGVEVFLEGEGVTLSIGQEEWSENLARLAATLADLVRRGEMRGIREVRVHGAGVWVIKKGSVAAG